MEAVRKEGFENFEKASDLKQAEIILKRLGLGEQKELYELLKNKLDLIEEKQKNVVISFNAKVDDSNED